MPGGVLAFLLPGGLLDAGGELGPGDQVPGSGEPVHAGAGLGQDRARGGGVDAGISASRCTAAANGAVICPIRSSSAAMSRSIASTRASIFSSRNAWWLVNLILVLAATLKSPGQAPGTRLINDLEDQGFDGVSGQQPPPISPPRTGITTGDISG